MKPAFLQLLRCVLDRLALDVGYLERLRPLADDGRHGAALGDLAAGRLLADDAAGLDIVVELLGGLELELGVLHHVARFVTVRPIRLGTSTGSDRG